MTEQSPLGLYEDPRSMDYCSCGEPLSTPYERREDACYDCQRDEERLYCVICEKYVGMYYADGRPTLCSDECERRYWDA